MLLGVDRLAILDQEQLHPAVAHHIGLVRRHVLLYVRPAFSSCWYCLRKQAACPAQGSAALVQHMLHSISMGRVLTITIGQTCHVLHDVSHQSKSQLWSVPLQLDLVCANTTTDSESQQIAAACLSVFHVWCPPAGPLADFHAQELMQA